ncbi:TPA: hypothetical protein DCQ44_02095, partial [Candidatus Taylorbacteria bacterium]|nr:hypothetical protein [Candidatus Taylorbacteria bacterium]
VVGRTQGVSGLTKLFMSLGISNKKTAERAMVVVAVIFFLLAGVMASYSLGLFQPKRQIVELGSEIQKMDQLRNQR